MNSTLQRLVLGCGLLAAGLGNAFAKPYEVWAIDQSNSAGKTYGGTLYVYDGRDLERGHAAASAVPEKIDLGAAAAALCFAKTGANPVRPHMLAINARQNRAIVSFVASGHVLVLDAVARTPVDCIRTSVGAGGARQVHFAIPSPDESYIAVANQNGKLFERIETDYATDTYTLNTSRRNRPGQLHDPQRRGLPGRSAAAGQRADLPDHRIDQPLRLRHAARWRAVRRRCKTHADADRRRIRPAHRTP